MNFSPKRLTTLKILDMELAISSFQKAKYVPCILFLVKLKATNNKSISTPISCIALMLLEGFRRAFGLF